MIGTSEARKMGSEGEKESIKHDFIQPSVRTDICTCTSFVCVLNKYHIRVKEEEINRKLLDDYKILSNSFEEVLTMNTFSLGIRISAMILNTILLLIAHVLTLIH